MIKLLLNGSKTTEIAADADFYHAKLEMDISDLKRLQTWGSAHVLTVDIKNGEQISRYQLLGGAGNNSAYTQAQLIAKTGAKKTVEKKSHWFRARFINFLERYNRKFPFNQS